MSMPAHTHENLLVLYLQVSSELEEFLLDVRACGGHDTNAEATIGLLEQQLTDTQKSVEDLLINPTLIGS